MHLNWFDLCLAGIVCSSMILGVVRGFLKEIISLISWLAAFFVSIMFTNSVSSYLSQYVKTEFLSSLLSFLLLFVLTLIAGSLLNYIISNLAQKTGLSIPDRVLGSIFGIMRGVMISLLVVFLISNTMLTKRRWFTRSALSSKLQDTSRWMQDRVIEVSKVTEEMR